MSISISANRRHGSDASEVDRVKTDFDAACMRARATPKSSDDSVFGTSTQPISTGPVRPKQKKHADSVSSLESTSHHSHKASDEKVLELAKKDLINLLKLKV